jgi:hypothetical protein
VFHKALDDTTRNELYRPGPGECYKGEVTDVCMDDPFPITVTYNDGGVDTYTVLEYQQLLLVGRCRLNL